MITTNKNSYRATFLGILLNTEISISYLCDLLERNDNLPILVTFINPYSWAVAKRNPKYLSALEKMDIVLPDGHGVVVACRLLCRSQCKRISFDMSSLAGPFFAAAEREGRSVMLVGGEEGIAARTAEKLKAHYPHLKVSGVANGYHSFDKLVADVIAKAPDIVVAGMGVPKQEFFLLALRDAGFRGFGITCGGFFNQYLEAVKYYPDWIDKHNLRFLWRLYKEPRRLWRRYLVDYQIFLRCFFKAAILKMLKAPC